MATHRNLSGCVEGEEVTRDFSCHGRSPDELHPARYMKPTGVLTMKRLSLSIIPALAIAICLAPPAQAGCKIPAPQALGFANDGGSCPSGYSSSGNACVPSSASSHYAFYTGGGSCPSGYSRSGNSCVASSASSCHAFFNGGGSCPSGYSRSGNSCVAH